jgi:hypothetical protein
MVQAAPSGKAGASKTSVSKAGAQKAKALPRYVSLSDIRKELAGRKYEIAPRLIDPSAPMLPEIQKTTRPVNVAQVARESAKRQVSKPASKASKSTRIAQGPGRPRTLRPAAVRAQRPVTPRWVRYPLEYQLCGIGLGTRAVDKDRFNRIDRYGLFAMHGNPTAVVVPIVGAAGGGGAAAGGGADATAAPAGGTDGAAATTTTVTTANLTVQQQPPMAASLFPASQNGELPDWASAVSVALDNNHVQWLYNRGTYAMGFVVDRLGYVDAIVVAGIESPIARTQLEDPVHTVKLGDDLRKVLFRYGYPDTVETYGVTAAASTTVAAPAAAAVDPAAALGAAAGGAAAGAGPDAAAGAAATGGATNGAFQTFELRYEQSYNVVFTIRYNRVVRIYIFGDPDFFNDQRRRQFRIAY